MFHLRQLPPNTYVICNGEEDICTVEWVLGQIYQGRQFNQGDLFTLKAACDDQDSFEAGNEIVIDITKENLIRVAYCNMCDNTFQSLIEKCPICEAKGRPCYEITDSFRVLNDSC